MIENLERAKGFEPSTPTLAGCTRSALSVNGTSATLPATLNEGGIPSGTGHWRTNATVVRLWDHGLRPWTHKFAGCGSVRTAL